MRGQGRLTQDHRGGAGDNIPLAASAILISVFLLSFGDSLIKSLGTGSNIGLWQLFLLRSAIGASALAFGAFLLVPRSALRPRALGWIALRSVMMLAMWVSYYVSLPHVPLAVAAAAYYTAPLFIVLFASLFGGERVIWRQWVSVALGFCGVVLILQPGGEAFSPIALLPLLAAVLYALAMVVTRMHCREEHPATVALGLHIAFMIGGAIVLSVLGLIPELAGESFVSRAWIDMDADSWIFVALLSPIILIASVGAAIAYQKAPSSVVSTCDFAYVGFAVMWGIVLFSEVPVAYSLIGMTLITGGGILVLRR